MTLRKRLAMCGRLFRGRPGVVAVVTAALLLVPPVLVSDYWMFILATALVYALASLSVNVLYGQAGMIGLFPAAFMGVGAYVAAAIEPHAHSWLVAMLGAVAGTTALGAVAGLPGIRLRGMVFGIVTFAMALAVNTVVFGEGFLGIDPALGASLARPKLGFWDLNRDQNFYYFSLIIAAVVLAVVLVHQRRRPGRAWRAIRDNELAALAAGVRVGRYKVWAAALSGAVAGVAGVLLLTLQSQANADPFTPMQSLLIFAAAVTAGTRWVPGAVLAGILLVVLPQLLSTIGVSPRVVPLVFAAGVLMAVKGPGDLPTAISGSRYATLARLRAART